MRSLLALVCIVAVGCAAPVDPVPVFECSSAAKPDAYTVEISPELKLAQRAAVVDAVGMWAEDSRLRAVVVVSDCTTIADAKEAVDDGVICVRAGAVADVERCGAGRLGCTHAHDVALRAEAFYPALVAHELGHALGLVHTEHGTLMFPDVSADARPTAEDVAQYDALRGRYCVGPAT